MPEGRFISKGIAVSEQLGAVSLEADYLFGRCIPFLDVEGRITGNPKGLKAAVCPLRDELTPAVIGELLNELDQAGLVAWYEVKGLKYLEFPTFARHQKGLKKDREAASKVPPRQVLTAQGVVCAVGVGPELVGSRSGVGPDLLLPRARGVKLSEVKLSEVEEGASSSSLVPDEYADDLRELVERISESGGSSVAWLAELTVAADGMHGPPKSAAVIGQAIRDFNAAGANISLRLFRGFLKSTADKAGSVNGKSANGTDYQSPEEMQALNRAELKKLNASREARGETLLKYGEVYAR